MVHFYKTNPKRENLKKVRTQEKVMGLILTYY